MNYREYLDSFSKFKSDGGFKPGLERVEAALRELGNPEKDLSIIHVAGTNGKGSTSVMLASILREAGYVVGFYSSPHIQRFEERFRINGVPILAEDLELMVEKIRPIMEKVANNPSLGRPTYFEVITVLALVYFAHKQVDAVVLEVGLGGRLDATNVVMPLAAVITSIGLDHTEYLGNTFAQIAFEKAGIIKYGTPVISGVTEPEAKEVIARVALEKEAPLYWAQDGAKWEIIEEGLAEQRLELTLGDQTYSDLKLALVGEHQIRNGLLALRTMEILTDHFPQVDEEAIRRGLEKVKWPGRLELMQENPAVLLDGAHNLQGIQALAQFLQRVKDHYDHLYLVMSIMKDKEVTAMVRQLAPLATRIIFTQNHSLRASGAEELARILEQRGMEKEVILDFESAIRETIATANENDLVCITGSLYTIAEAREILRPNDQGII